MIELPVNIEKRLIHAAQDKGQNLAQFVEQLLERYLEDKTDTEAAEAGYREFIDSGVASIPFEQLMTTE